MNRTLNQALDNAGRISAELSDLIQPTNEDQDMVVLAGEVFRLREILKKNNIAYEESKKFKCPECGGSRWGTANCTQDFSQWVGRCNDCNNFKWPRTEDGKYFS